MYKQLTELLFKTGRPMFSMAIGHLMYLGYQTVLEITDKDIEEVEGNAMMTKEFSQEIVSTARQIAKITEEDPMLLFTFCQNINLFDRNRGMPFEETVIATTTWIVQDVIDAYEEKYGKEPSREKLDEILDVLYTDALEDCSSGWDVISTAIWEVEHK